MYRNRRKSLLSLVLILVLGIGLGYAFLSSNLKINGKNGISKNSWVIYFENIQNQSGVVATNSKISADKQTIDFDISIKKPGDYYEFDVDTVNDGTIDAMIESVEFEGLDNKFNDLVYFDVNYKDNGMPLEKCDVLKKNLGKQLLLK